MKFDGFGWRNGQLLIPSLHKSGVFSDENQFRMCINDMAFSRTSVVHGCPGHEHPGNLPLKKNTTLWPNAAQRGPSARLATRIVHGSPNLGKRDHKSKGLINTGIVSRYPETHKIRTLCFVSAEMVGKFVLHRQNIVLSMGNESS